MDIENIDMLQTTHESVYNSMLLVVVVGGGGGGGGGGWCLSISGAATSDQKCNM
jgi:hypothetical protein